MSDAPNALGVLFDASGTWLSSIEIAEKTGIKPEFITGTLAPAVKAGTVLRKGGRYGSYRLKECLEKKDSWPRHSIVSANDAPPLEHGPSSVFDVPHGIFPEFTPPPKAIEHYMPEGPKTVEQFRCGLFNDGELVLDVDGRVVSLCRAYTTELLRYLDRISITEGAV